MIDAELPGGDNLQINGLKQEIKERDEPDQVIGNEFTKTLKRGTGCQNIYFLLILTCFFTHF